MATIWITYDPRGQSVVLTDDAWEHILYEHPTLAGHQRAIRLALERPLLCTKELDGSLNYYASDVLPARLGRYLNVLVRPSELADLEVRTAWPTDSVDAYEERVW